jgi:hypothetical protein
VLTALAFVLIIGRADRFQCGKQIASYLGLVPLEKSSGNQRRLGHITKQGNTLLRFLLVEAAQVTVRSIRTQISERAARIEIENVGSNDVIRIGDRTPRSGTIGLAVLGQSGQSYHNTRT